VIGSDRAVRTQESAEPVYHAMEPRKAAHQQPKVRFIDSMSRYLGEADGRKEFDKLILIAPPRSIGELRDALEPGAAAKVAALLAKDLTKMPNFELEKYFERI
jgi:protein required for attachment to host cells